MMRLAEPIIIQTEATTRWILMMRKELRMKVMWRLMMNLLDIIMQEAIAMERKQEQLNEMLLVLLIPLKKEIKLEAFPLDLIKLLHLILMVLKVVKLILTRQLVNHQVFQMVQN